MHRRAFLKIAAALPLAAGAAGCGLVGPPRHERLTRGVNLSHWFAQTPVTPARLRGHIVPQDLAQLAAAGFRHVRLPLDPGVLFQGDAPDTLAPRYLPHFDAAVDMILAADLAVIVELHPDVGFMARLKVDDALVDATVRSWRALASHLSGRDPKLVYLEAMNEANFDMPERWEPILGRLLAAMRDGAPQHTLIASGDHWASIDGLLKLSPVRDPNVVYNFHFYEPFTFTHQGATWGAPNWRHLRAVPYPSSPEAVAPVLRALDNAAAQGELRQYGADRWDHARVERRLRQAADWGAAHRAALTCNEFGVYRLVAPPGDRTAYLADVRSALERLEIGWAMWDYADGFGVSTSKRPPRTLDPLTLAALGLGG